jgi:hypothetical protein
LAHRQSAPGAPPPEAAADGRPGHSYFFMSYARVPSADSRARDPDSLVVDFHQQLCQHILQLTAHDGAAPAGFLDRRLRIGSEWEYHLKLALATCQVFVPVYTQRYFSSEWCGKEWDAFERRQDLQRRTRAYTVNAIVPVLWLPPSRLDLPPVAEAVQYTHIDLGRPYLEKGLYGLLAEGFTQRYRRAVWGIAQTIVEVAQRSRLEPCDVSYFDDLRNVFREEPEHEEKPEDAPEAVQQMGSADGSL